MPLRRGVEVSGFVDDHRRIPGTRGYGAFRRLHGGSDDAASASDQYQIDPGMYEQVLCGLDTGLMDRG